MRSTLEIFTSRILKSSHKKKLLSPAVVNGSVSHVANRLSFDIIKKVVEEVANVLTKLIIKMSEISAVCCVVSAGVIESCHKSGADW